MVLAKVRCASPLSKAIPSCKTDGGVGDYDISEGPKREVELRGGFLAASFPHPQQFQSKRMLSFENQIAAVLEN
jgi:hypothetical protein